MPNNLIAHLAKDFMSGGSDEVVDIITFAEAQWGLNINLLPTQRFMLKCFYGMELDDVNKTIDVPDYLNEKILYSGMTERKFLDFLYAEGRCNTDEVQGMNFHEMVLVLGRRGTKSTLASCISNYELYKLVKRGNPSAHFGFPSNTEIVILNVAPTDEQAGQVFNMIQTQALGCPYLRNRCLHNTKTYFDIQADSDKEIYGKPRATLMSLAGGCSSNALRGRNAIVVIMDEMAFFIDKENSRFSGGEVYKALTPSMTAFGSEGKVLCLSSPYGKFGRFYDRYQESFDEPDYTLMFRMYTAMANPTVPSEILRAAYRRDRTGLNSQTVLQHGLSQIQSMNLRNASRIGRWSQRGRKKFHISWELTLALRMTEQLWPLFTKRAIRLFWITLMFGLVVILMFGKLVIASMKIVRNTEISQFLKWLILLRK
jgi:hypothetical protein